MATAKQPFAYLLTKERLLLLRVCRGAQIRGSNGYRTRHPRQAERADLTSAPIGAHVPVTCLGWGRVRDDLLTELRALVAARG